MPNTSQHMKPLFYFCLRIGNWKWDSGGIQRWRKISSKSGKTSWMQWERVYIFGPPPEKETQP